MGFAPLRCVRARENSPEPHHIVVQPIDPVAADFGQFLRQEFVNPYRLLARIHQNLLGLDVVYGVFLGHNCKGNPLSR